MIDISKLDTMVKLKLGYLVFQKHDTKATVIALTHGIAGGDPSKYDSETKSFLKELGWKEEDSMYSYRVYGGSANSFMLATLIPEGELNRPSLNEFARYIDKDYKGDFNKPSTIEILDKISTDVIAPVKTFKPLGKQLLTVGVFPGKIDKMEFAFTTTIANVISRYLETHPSFDITEYNIFVDDVLQLKYGFKIQGDKTILFKKK